MRIYESGMTERLWKMRRRGMFHREVCDRCVFMTAARDVDGPGVLRAGIVV
ncbi:MAG: hypothetical protein H0U65_12800 [Rubrobacter sp.]|nr:hypothetical protein [Rubrobacter sp.]